ncbi:MAG: segregation/condensation protein A [Verrucomicrobia bacterium]|nr:segregation/condensation protein A [Verrucomicrobiota bacterium]
MNPDLTPAPIPVPESDPFLPLDPPGSTVDLSRWKQIPLGLMNEYRVQFDVFEGPLDLLLHLVKKQEVDIYQVNLTRIASEFVAYIDQMRELDLEIAGEFLVMAATLIYIKSRELLPADQKPEAQIGEEDEEDPRFELIRRLVEYKKFKDAAAELQSLETRMDQVYEHRSAQVVLPEIEPQRREPVSIFELIQAVSVILKRFGERDDVREIQADPYTVSEKMAALRMLIQEKGRFRFSDLFAEARSRSEVVVTFLAMLELTRLRHLQVIQSEDFGEIEVELAPPEAPSVEAPEEPVLEESENLGTSPAQSTRPQESPDEEPTED